MTDYEQIALNPELTDWSHRETKIDHQYKEVVIEEAADWEYVYIPGLENSKGEHPDHIDYNRIPQSIHYDDGMKITWGWMKFQAGYRQPITLTKGQRYTAVVKFEGDINFTQDPRAIQWMFFVDGLQSTQSDWASYSSIGDFGRPVEHQFVFEATQDGWVDLTFWAKAEWPDSAGEVRVKSISVFKVPQDYGVPLPITPFPNDDQHPPDPDPPEPEPIAGWWDMIGVRPWMILVALIAIPTLIAILYSIIAPRLQAQGVQTMEELLSQIFAIPVFAAITYTSGIVYFLVEVIKRLKGRFVPDDKMEWLTPEFSAITLIVLFLGIHGIASEYAYDNTLKTVAQFVTELIGVLGPYLLGIIATNAVTSYSYRRLRGANVPGFTYGK